MSEFKYFYYTSTHEWIKKDNNNLVIGITDHAQKKLGDLVFVELPEVGQQLEANSESVVVESVKAAADVYAPVSGEVSDINSSLESSPENVNSEPYTDGWLYKIKPSCDINDDNIKAFNWMSYSEYQELLQEES